MSQCLNVSCLAACLRERAARASAQPSYRKLAHAARLGETHPGIRSPVARLKNPYFGPPTAQVAPEEAQRDSKRIYSRELCRGAKCTSWGMPLDGRLRTDDGDAVLLRAASRRRWL